MEWTLLSVLQVHKPRAAAARADPVALRQVTGLFLAAGLAEIAGGWLVWETIRDGKPWWW